MSARSGTGRWVRWGLPLVAALAVIVGVLAPARSASAHPLDQYLQISYVTVDPTQITVEIAFTPGVLLAPDALPKIDANGDQVISEAEAQAYAQTIVDALSLSVDGQDIPLTMTTVSMPAYLVVQAGYGETKIVATGQLPVNTTGEHELTFSNSFEPASSKYQVNGFVTDASTVQLGAQDRSDNQQRMKIAFTIGAASASTASSSDAQVNVGTTLAGAGQAQRLMKYFESSSNAPTALMIALMLGALHALTPGHGKTLVAAYLVGSRGTVKHAVALGAIVTFTHTSSVIAIGVIALFASHYIMPSVLVPALEVLSGLLVVALGCRLILSRYQTYRAQKRHEQEHALAHTHGLEHPHDHEHEHVHPHVHDHTHDHEDGVFWHDHGDGHAHSHAMPETITSRGLLAMGISGGMVPCPEALGIMIIAIGLHRIALGLGLIVSFSLGLAAVLIGIGIVLVRSRMLVEKTGFLGSRLTSAVIPLASAVIVTVLGIGIAFGGLTNYLG